MPRDPFALRDGGSSSSNGTLSTTATVGTATSLTNAFALAQIRHEIGRFESVHPCIYAVYDLIDLIENPVLQTQLRDQVVCIEDAFVNSQEWTLSRGVPELKLGVVGSNRSGKASLVHRYLTGSYSSEESPEGGRFKKELTIDNQSYLVLIRDEGGVPEQQFCHWVDAVIFVFSVENQESFETVQHFFNHMSKFRNIGEVPIILVGTQETDTRKLSHGLRRCAYWETCATYGLNVEKVFKDACQRIIQQRVLRSLGASANNARTPPPPTTPQGDHYQVVPSLHNHASAYQQQHLKTYHQRSASVLPSSSQEPARNSRTTAAAQYPPSSPVAPRRGGTAETGTPAGHLHREHHHPGQGGASVGDRFSAFAMPVAPLPQPTHAAAYANRASDFGPLSPTHHSAGNVIAANGALMNCGGRSSAATLYQFNGGVGAGAYDFSTEQWDGQIHSQPSHYNTAALLPHATASTSHLPTPSSTPTAQRKNRRISNIFQRPKDHHNDEKARCMRDAELSMGVGRAIPVKQGHLYKRSKKALNKEWKKKYVCLYSDGRLSYHHNLKDYMDKDANGKEVYLGLATVRVAGRQRPRGAQRAHTQPITSTHALKENNFVGKRESLDPAAIQKLGLDLASSGGENHRLSLAANGGGVTTPGEAGGTSAGSDEGIAPGSQLMTTPSASASSAAVGKKKRGHRRLGSSAKNNDDDDECCEFEIISCDQKRWEFSATSPDERDEWVSAIETQIEKALQAQTSQKQAIKNGGRAHGDKAEVQALRQLPGNGKCADCGASTPDWASLNLGTLICIECSGIHRNLGSHLSRVRSLDLDDWPVEYLAVMQAIGNDVANRLWEHNAPRDRKPTPDSNRESKEAWIRAKYEQKRYLPAVPVDRTLGRQLIDAVLAVDLGALMNVLPRCGDEDVNAVVGGRDRRTALHLACSIGSPELTQLLLWYNADIRAVDDMGRSALWHAQNSGSRACATLLLNAGLDANYGIPENNQGVHGGIGAFDSCHSARGDPSTGFQVIGHAHDNNLARLRRASDIGANARNGGPRGVIPERSSTTATATSNNSAFQQRACDAFERLPASVI